MFHFSDFLVPKAGIAIAARQPRWLSGQIIFLCPGDRIGHGNQRARQDLIDMGNGNAGAGKIARETVEPDIDDPEARSEQRVS